MNFLQNWPKKQLFSIEVSVWIFFKIKPKAAIWVGMIFMIIIQKYLKILHLFKIRNVFNTMRFFSQDLLYIWWFCRKIKKLFCKGIYNAVSVNHIRLTYGDFEKVSKKHENAMKNGKFINFFWWKMEKTCSIMVSKVKSHSMAGRGDFSKTWLLLYQGILIFLVCGLYADGKWSFFWMSFFLFCKGMFQKTAKKKNWSILWLSKLIKWSLKYHLSISQYEVTHEMTPK
jgi:hypothetical protein